MKEEHYKNVQKTLITYDNFLRQSLKNKAYTEMDIFKRVTAVFKDYVVEDTILDEKNDITELRITMFDKKFDYIIYISLTFIDKKELFYWENETLVEENNEENENNGIWPL